MAEEKDEKPASAATKTYKVADGHEISVVDRGERVVRKGGEKVQLTESQAVAFSDKLEGETPTETDPASVVVGEEVGNRATIVEAAADAAAASDLGKEERKSQPSDETNTASGASTTAASQQAGAGVNPAQKAAAATQAGADKK
jgi:hypothetical protein